jgi:hypothetical protein
VGKDRAPEVAAGTDVSGFSAITLAEIEAAEAEKARRRAEYNASPAGQAERAEMQAREEAANRHNPCMRHTGRSIGEKREEAKEEMDYAIAHTVPATIRQRALGEVIAKGDWDMDDPTPEMIAAFDAAVEARVAELTNQ